jgi:hypothetical protein
MGLIKEPKNVDFIIKSEPWSENELLEFRAIIKKKKKKTPIVKIDKTLEKFRDKVLFKNKLNNANKVLKTVGLPR